MWGRPLPARGRSGEEALPPSLNYFRFFFLKRSVLVHFCTILSNLLGSYGHVPPGPPNVAGPGVTVPSLPSSRRVWLGKDFNGLSLFTIDSLIDRQRCMCRRAVVYRGCADPRNLPLGVDSSLQCREQGPLPAVWWFCNGTLCNSEQFSTACSADSSKGGKSGQTLQQLNFIFIINNIISGVYPLDTLYKPPTSINIDPQSRTLS